MLMSESALKEPIPTPTSPLLTIWNSPPVILMVPPRPDPIPIPVVPFPMMVIGPP